MHLSSWLLLITFLAQGIDAFYPFHYPKPSKGVQKTRRFYPWTIGHGVGTDSPEIPTLSIKKGPVKRTLNARANNFPVVEATPPSMKNSLAVDEDGKDYSYIATMKFGSEGKPMYMLVDTGAANTWVMGSNCRTSSCQKHNLFGSADSTTLEISNTPWDITYGTGTVSGVVVNDTVAFAGFNVETGFGLASTTSDDFNTYPMDGILGLGRPASNKLGVPTVMQTLMNANLLKAKILGIHLQRNADGATDGEVNFGALDTSRFDGNVHYTDSVSTDGMWEIPIDDAGVDGKTAGFSGRTAIVDTGTTFILMADGDAKKLHALIDGATEDDDGNWLVPCSSTAPLQFTFSGKVFDVSHKDYVGAVQPDGKMCLSTVIAHQTFGATQWLMGDVFLKNVYSVFDFEKNRIGFGVKSTTGNVQSHASNPGSSSSSISTPAPHTQSSKAQSSPTTSAPDNGNSSPAPSSKDHTPAGSSASATSNPSSASASGTASPSSTASSSSSGSTSANSTTKASGQGLGSSASSLNLDLSMAVVGMSCSLLALLFSWA